MAAPNLLALTTINAQTAILEATTTETDLIAAMATGHIANVEAIYCANIHPTVVGWVTVIHKQAATDHTIAFQVRIPVKTTINVLLGKPLYLAEADSVRVIANAASNVSVFAPYTNMS